MASPAPPGRWLSLTPALIWSPWTPTRNGGVEIFGFPAGETHLQVPHRDSSPDHSAYSCSGTRAGGLLSLDFSSWLLIKTPSTRKASLQRTKPSPAELIIFTVKHGSKWNPWLREKEKAFNPTLWCLPDWQVQKYKWKSNYTRLTSLLRFIFQCKKEKETEKAWLVILVSIAFSANWLEIKAQDVPNYSKKLLL